jgi:hypothetical protein
MSEQKNMDQCDHEWRLALNNDNPYGHACFKCGGLKKLLPENSPLENYRELQNPDVL